MKNLAVKLMMIGVALLLCVGSVQAKERIAIADDELSTLQKLGEWGIAVKPRTGVELNQPLSAIDAMSMEIKGLSESGKAFNNALQETINILKRSDDRLNEMIIENQVNYAELALDQDDMKNKIDENFWNNVWISGGLFLLGLIL